jgi:hypothetical protein
VKIGEAGAGALSSAARPRHEPVSATPLEREQKRLVTCAQAQHLLDRIAERAELEIHDPARPVELTWTTYLDTDDLRFFASSRSGPARRVRIREYASCETPSAAPAPAGVSFLELKESAAGRRRKLRYRSDRAGIDRLLEILAGGVRPAFDDVAVAEIARALAGVALRPRVCTLYRRLSLAVTPWVRITFDEDVRFYRPPAGDEAAIGPREALLGAVPGVVVEVKGRGAVPAWLSASLERIEPLPDFSKFRLGLELLTHAQTQAKPRLRAATGEPPLVVPPALRRVVPRLA